MNAVGKKHILCVDLSAFCGSYFIYIRGKDLFYMPIGYNVIQPNGVVRKLRAADDADRKSMVDAL